MTDKQIIIDDLKEMIYKLQIECVEKTDNILALGEQLKAKEQECEELKDKLNCCFCNPITKIADHEHLKKCVETTECFRRQLDKLKAENEELTSKCSQLKLENIKQGNKILALKSKRLNMFEHLDIVQKNIEYEEFLKDLKITAERARKRLFATKSEDYSDGMERLGSLLWNRIEELEEKLQK